MQIIGHHTIRARLQKQVREKMLSQGYLFYGPESVGKSLCAQEFSYQLVASPSFQPSQEQPHPLDVRIIRPDEETKHGVTKKKNISAQTMREALLFLGSFPITGSFRVVIVEEAHTLSHTAQNLLLKTLEEPQSTAVIILVTHTIGNIVSTILSRVEKIRFDYVPAEDIRSGIQELIPSDAVSNIAPFFFSLGRPGMILQAVHHPEQFTAERTKLERLFRLSSLSLSQRIAFAEELSKNVPEAIRLFEWWLPGLHTQALKSTEKRHTVNFFGLLEKIKETLTLLKTTQSNARLLFEKLFLTL